MSQQHAEVGVTHHGTRATMAAQPLVSQPATGSLPATAAHVPARVSQPVQVLVVEIPVAAAVIQVVVLQSIRVTWRRDEVEALLVWSDFECRCIFCSGTEFTTDSCR